MEAVVIGFPRFNAKIATLGVLIICTMENIYAFHKRALTLLFVTFTLGYFLLNLYFNPFLNKAVSSTNVMLYSTLGFLSICCLGWVYYLVTSRRYWYVGLLLLPVAFILLTVISHYLIYDVFPQIGHAAYRKVARTYKEFLILSIPRFYYYSIAALFFVFVVRFGLALIGRFKAENEKNRTQVARLEAEKTALEMEMRALGAYSNPHLLFNELEDIRSELLDWKNPDVDQLAKRTQVLAEIMRYNAENVYHNRRIVVIEREWAQLMLYLNSRYERIRGYQAPAVEVIGELAGQKIVPMTLIYFAENAYTHGDMRSAPLTIRMELLDDSLKVVFRNKIATSKPNNQSLGSGLEIARRRLELAMPNRFSLTTRTEGLYFETVLTIDQ